MTTPTTPTFEDKQAEVKKLNGVIAGLVQEKDINALAVKESIVALNDVKAQKAALVEEMGTLSEVLTAILVVAKDCVEQSQQIVKDAREIIVGYTKEIRKLDDQVIATQILVKNSTEEVKINHEKIVAETENLTQFKQGLELFQTRLESLIKDNGVDLNKL